MGRLVLLGSHLVEDCRQHCLGLVVLWAGGFFSAGELYDVGHLFGDEGGVVLAADFGRIAHESGYLVEAFAFLGELAAEGVAVIQAAPGQAMLAIDIPQVMREIVGIPSAAFGRREEPYAARMRPAKRFQDGEQRITDGNDAVPLRFWLPELAVDGLGLNSDQAFVEVNVLGCQPGGGFAAEACVDVGRDHRVDSRMIFQHIKLPVDVLKGQEVDLRSGLLLAVHAGCGVGVAAVEADEIVTLDRVVEHLVQDLATVVDRLGRPVVFSDAFVEEAVDGLWCDVLQVLRVDVLASVFVALRPSLASQGRARRTDLQ